MVPPPLWYDMPQNPIPNSKAPTLRISAASGPGRSDRVSVLGCLGSEEKMNQEPTPNPERYLPSALGPRRKVDQKELTVGPAEELLAEQSATRTATSET